MQDDIFKIDDTNNHRLLGLSNQTIENLYDHYKDDLYITSKIHHYITQQLPMLLENIKRNREKSIQRTEEHSTEQQRFMQSYLSRNIYFYNPTTETYYFYDGIHYKETTEDEILHDIVTTISKDHNPLLMNWKHKTKVSILKKIKDQHIMKVIPESETIQMVIQQIYPFIFSSKLEAKYFLTIIGDNILKKNLSLIHYIHPTVKDFLKGLNQLSVEKLHVQCTQTFKHKYHEKHYEQNNDCRLVPIMNLSQKESVTKHWYQSILQFCGLDILCVALHYSRKYGSSDDYVLERSNDIELQTYVFELNNNDAEDKIQQFSKEYLYDYGKEDQQMTSSSPQDYFLQNHLQINSNENKLTWGEMQYLWKDFLQIHNLPQNLYQNVYKTLLIDRYSDKYNKDSDTFYTLGSSQLPMVQKFLKFWSETIVEDTNTYAELETEEISALFRNWLQNGRRKQKYLLKESKILDMLSYFHPELEIGENKYIFRVRNLQWDKDIDIEVSLDTLREKENDSLCYPSITLYDAYLYYCKFHNSKDEDGNKPLLVSKQFFEKYVTHHYDIFLDHSNTFTESWFIQRQL
jgi:hypothetical protein